MGLTCNGKTANQNDSSMELVCEKAYFQLLRLSRAQKNNGESEVISKEDCKNLLFPRNKFLGQSFYNWTLRHFEVDKLDLVIWTQAWDIIARKSTGRVTGNILSGPPTLDTFDYLAMMASACKPKEFNEKLINEEECRRVFDIVINLIFDRTEYVIAEERIFFACEMMTSIILDECRRSTTLPIDGDSIPIRLFCEKTKMVLPRISGNLSAIIFIQLKKIGSFQEVDSKASLPKVDVSDILNITYIIVLYLLRQEVQLNRCIRKIFSMNFGGVQFSGVSDSLKGYHGTVLLIAKFLPISVTKGNGLRLRSASKDKKTVKKYTDKKINMFQSNFMGLSPLEEDNESLVSEDSEEEDTQIMGVIFEVPLKQGYNRQLAPHSQIINFRPILSLSEGSEICIYYDEKTGIGFSNKEQSKSKPDPQDYNLWIGKDLMNDSYFMEGDLGKKRQLYPTSIEVFSLGNEGDYEKWQTFQSKSPSNLLESSDTNIIHKGTPKEKPKQFFGSYANKCDVEISEADQNNPKLFLSENTKKQGVPDSKARIIETQPNNSFMNSFMMSNGTYPSNHYYNPTPQYLEPPIESEGINLKDSSPSMVQSNLSRKDSGNMFKTTYTDPYGRRLLFSNKSLLQSQATPSENL